ncbi:MAG: hypothetical protein ACR2FV_18115 [Ornithinimicrobium sp.]|uniref:hypothetical protein n=1 Tax=Ornithinimicrobium sp. TaxID=1977084 RepID=UPI003D9ABDE4
MSDPTALPNFPPPPEEHPLRGRVLDALQDLEYGPDLDAQGDVSFTAQSQKLFVRCMEGGQVDIMRTFGQWQIADNIPADMTTRLNACNDITLGVNLVKAGIAAGNLVLTVEQIIAKQENPKAKAQISVGLLLQAVQLWHKNVVAKSQRATAEPGGEAPEIAPWLSEAVGRPPQHDGDQSGTEGEDPQA